MQANLETELSSQGFAPLPPVQEFALSPSQKLELKPYFERQLGGKSFMVLMLCRQTKALTVGDFVLGAKGSRHSQSSLVLAERSQTGETIGLAEIQYFMECVAIPNNDHTQAVKLWIACVNWFQEHPCKVWYGNPVQVWTTVSTPGSFLVPVRSIKSRLVYVKCTRDFGTVLVNDTVYVVVPLMSNEL